MILAFAAAVMMSANVMAQNERPQGQQMDRAEMLKLRTDQMVKDYGLNEDQAKKVLDLNTKYADKIPMMRGRGGQGQRGERPQGQEGQRQRPQGDARPQGQGGQRSQADFEEMRKNMEDYNAELQKIMTEEQFKKYTENNSRRGGQGQRGQGQGPRQRNN